jgi:hypothetical protein
MAFNLSNLIGSVSSNSEAIVTVQTALGSHYCFSQKLVAKNPQNQFATNSARRNK